MEMITRTSRNLVCHTIIVAFFCFDPVFTVFTWKGHIKCQVLINDATERTCVFHILSMICDIIWNIKCFRFVFLPPWKRSMWGKCSLKKHPGSSQGLLRAPISFGNIPRTNGFSETHKDILKLITNFHKESGVGVFDISISHIDYRYIDTFWKYRYRYQYR